jgi:UDP-glucuronate decarboxylase
MRVLVTGGYGFIGSFVAETFFKEGHDIYIIDNLSSGNKENVPFNHKFYQLNVDDPKCEDIFKSNGFDVVIHLAAQVNVATSMENPYLDSQSNVLGLANILQLSKKYGVKKVVFASSAAVYGQNKEIPLTEKSVCNPLSPYGMNKLVGELYCKKWTEVFGLDTLCFRFSNVYGPKQGTVGEGGVISIFINNVLQGKSLEVFGDGEQTRDFIFVGDVANAIYRGVEYEQSGIYNLSTNTETSVNEFIHSLESLAEVKGVLYKDQKLGDIKYSRLDNTRLKKDLDWVPLHNFQDGLGITYEWFKENAVKKKSTNLFPIKSKWLDRSKTSLPYFGNLAVFVIAIFVNLLLKDNLNLIDYRLFYIVSASFLFGRSQSIISIGLGTVWYLYQNVMNGQEIISQLIDHNTLVHIGLYFFIGLTLGYVIDKKEKLIISSRAEVESIQEKYQSLAAVFNDALTVKDELQNQILYTNNSIATVSDVMKNLNSLDPEKIIQSSIQIVENVMKSDGAAIYLFDSLNEQIIVEAKSDSLVIPSSTFIREHNFLTRAIQTNSVEVNKGLDMYLPSMIAPISINGTLIGVIGLFNPQFECLTLAYQNRFQVIANLISSAMSRAYEHEKALDLKRPGKKRYFINKEEAYV